MTQEVSTIDQTLNSSSETIPITTINSPLPSISANIDSKSNAHNHELNPINSLPTYQRHSIESCMPPRKSSSSGPEDFDEGRHHTFPRQRRRRNININNNKSNDQHTSQINNIDNDLHKHSKNVTFHLSPSIITTDQNPQRKLSNHITYTSSEEGEVEEIHSDSYILDDEKHRAKHDQSYGHCSSESEMYGEKTNHSSSKNDGKILNEFYF